MRKPLMRDLNVCVAQFRAFSVSRVWSVLPNGRVPRVCWHVQDDRGGRSFELFATRAEALDAAEAADLAQRHDYANAIEDLGRQVSNPKVVKALRNLNRDRKAYLAMPMTGLAKEGVR